MSRFKVGDRVTRSLFLDDGTWARLGDSCLPGPMLHGKVTKVYSKPAKRYGEYTVLGPYPELYGVWWDTGRYKQGYLPHGLDPEGDPA